MTASRLSVIMPMHNAERFVGAAIDSILAQTLGDFTFHIIDDGSTDRSGAIVEAKAAADSRIQLIRQDNQGIVASLNRMLAAVDTEYVARMDADDIALPDRFERQLAHLVGDTSLGALGTQFIEIDQHGAVIDAGFSQPIGRDAVRAQLEVRQPIANPSAMFRTQKLREAGLYRQAFRYCEDYDLFLRLSEIADIDNLPDVLLHYRRSPGQMSIANNVRQTRQAAYARFAHRERVAGRDDPFDGLEMLPSMEGLDQLIGRAGVGVQIEEDILANLRFSVASMTRDEFAYYCAKLASGIPFAGGRRAVLRCLANRRPLRAWLLARSLVTGRYFAPRVANQGIGV